MAEDALERNPEGSSRAELGVRKIGVIGAGQMGNGIAHVAALAGYKVISTICHARSTTRRWKHFQQHGPPGLEGQDNRSRARRGLARISFADSLEALGDADLIVEAVTEDEDIKRGF